MNEKQSIEQLEKDKRFVVFIHGWLITYLVLHQFLVPLASNLYFKRNLLYEVEPFFALQIGLFFIIRKYYLEKWHILAINIGLAGSIVRMGTLLFSMIQYGVNWKFASIALTEVSCLVFYFYNLNLFTKSDRKWFQMPSFVGTLIFGSLIFSMTRPDVEIMDSTKKKRFSVNKNTQLSEQRYSWGCKGVQAQINSEVFQSGLGQEVGVDQCGFERVFSAVSDYSRLKITNRTRGKIRFKVFELRQIAGQASWKFVRVISLASEEVWTADQMDTEKAYLLRSDTRKEIGNHLIVSDAFFKRWNLKTLNLDYDRVSLEQSRS